MADKSKETSNEELREGVRLFTERAVAKIEAGKAANLELRKKDELTSAEAASVLHVKQSHVEKLIHSGELPITDNRTLLTKDVLVYKTARDKRMRENLDKLTALSEEANGGYQ